MNKQHRSVFLVACLLLGACASERIVLLPSPDGRRTGVVVHDSEGDRLLDKPFAAWVRWGAADGIGYFSSAEDLRKRFAAALSAQPPAPSSYVLYFETGGNTLTVESKAAFDRIRKEIGERAASEVMVIGHTDRVGTPQSNDELSRRRAEGVRQALIESGIPPAKLEVVGRGERDPLVPTEDEVDEPRNRRVEINLR